MGKLQTYGKRFKLIPAKKSGWVVVQIPATETQLKLQ